MIDKSIIEIIPFKACRLSSRNSQIDAIFYQASAIQSFASASARKAFHWLWLGRYLNEEPEHSFLAVTQQHGVVGYLAGSLADPAQRQAFNDLPYVKDFAHMTAHYPAHFHINVAKDLRSAGIGARLVEAFTSHAHSTGTSGIHIVTGRDMRNVGFYTRNGFEIRASTSNGSRELVLLVRQL